MGRFVSCLLTLAFAVAVWTALLLAFEMHALRGEALMFAYRLGKSHAKTGHPSCVKDDIDPKVLADIKASMPAESLLYYDPVYFSSLITLDDVIAMRTTEVFKTIYKLGYDLSNTGVNSESIISKHALSRNLPELR